MDVPLSVDVADADAETCDFLNGKPLRLLTLLLSAFKSTGMDAVSE